MNSELSYISQPIDVGPEPAPQNFISRMIGVWFSPGEAFAEISRAPRILIPTLLLFVLAGASNYLVIDRFGYENIVRKQMESMVNAGWISQDKADEVIQQELTPSKVSAGKIQSGVVAAVWIVVLLTIMAGLFKAFTLLMGKGNRFKQVYSVTAYAFLATTLISTVVTLISIYLKDPADLDIYNPVASNLGAILPMMVEGLPKFILGLASFVDVFGIWNLTLLAIGYAAITHKMKTGTAGVFLVILYVIGAFVWAGFLSIFK